MTFIEYLMLAILLLTSTRAGCNPGSRASRVLDVMVALCAGMALMEFRPV